MFILYMLALFDVRGSENGADNFRVIGIYSPNSKGFLSVLAMREKTK